jgi:hypothetical protein
MIYSIVQQKTRWNNGIIELAVAHGDHEGFGNVRCEDTVREPPTRCTSQFQIMSLDFIYLVNEDPRAWKNT